MEVKGKEERARMSRGALLFPFLGNIFSSSLIAAFRVCFSPNHFNICIFIFSVRVQSVPVRLARDGPHVDILFLLLAAV